MKTAYFDCPAGAAGDMILAALAAAGADRDAIAAAVDGVAGFASGISFAEASQSGIHGLKLLLDLPHEHEHRTLADIRRMIDRAAASGTLDIKAAAMATAIFERLARAEARIHGVDMDDVHFHEVGALDSIADIVGIAAALKSLGVERVAASPLPMTRGTVRTMHGIMPVPAPATVEVLSGYEVYGVDAEGEFVTPTGAAVCAELARSASPMPRMTVTSAGFGFGTRRWPDGRPNCVRVIVGTDATDDETEWELSANIDDSSPDQIARLVECLMRAGAFDAWITPIVMKKGRPAWTVSAICTRDMKRGVEQVFFTESSTIGVRAVQIQRTRLDREFTAVETSVGRVRVKTATLSGKPVNVAPESDDLRAISNATGIPMKDVRRIVELEIAPR